MKIKIEVIKGGEGHCLVIATRRVAGPKPWGGGSIVHSFCVELEELERLLKSCRPSEKNEH